VQIGVISDTHNFFDPKIRELFAKVVHIIHAGDIGLPRILVELERLAPVTAVCGNTDDPAFRYEMTRVVQLSGRKFLVHHIVNPHELTESLRERINRERPDLVIFGHTHKPFFQEIDGTFYFNPGYAGKSRFGMDRTLAILEFPPGKIRPEYFKL